MKRGRGRGLSSPPWKDGKMQFLVLNCAYNRAYFPDWIGMIVSNPGLMRVKRF